MVRRKIAFYIRLSDADEAVRNGSREESNSITAQRNLLYSYVKENSEFSECEVMEFFDDGYSGTAFHNRADFQRMIKAAKEGAFGCILVKDFSRFGRDYLEVGNYLEFIFPSIGMRFLSVNDGYDSDKNFGMTGGMDIAFKNLINHLYSRDLSKKVKTAKKTRNQNGEFTGPFAGYGYQKDPNNYHKLIIDGEAADVIREIFRLTVAGHGTLEITRMLNEKNVPSPAVRERQNGAKIKRGIEGAKSLWTGSTVSAIIRNEKYTGKMIQNKVEASGFGDNRKQVPVDRKDWTVVEGGVPRIISDEVFAMANDLHNKVYGERKHKKDVNLFKCAYCGRRLVVTYRENGHYICRIRNYENETECRKVFINQQEVQDSVLAVVNKISRLLIDNKMKSQSKTFKKADELSIKMQEIQKEADSLQNNVVSLYQSYREGKYAKEEYLKIRGTNEELLDSMKMQLEELTNQKKGQEKERRLLDAMNEDIIACSMLEEYNGNLISNMVKEVIVHGSSDFEIVWNNDDFYKLMTAGKAV